MNALKKLATITALVAEIGDCDEIHLTLDAYIKNLTELKTVLTPSKESESSGEETQPEKWDMRDCCCSSCDFNEAYREGKKDGREEVERELRACEEDATESEEEEEEQK